LIDDMNSVLAPAVIESNSFASRPVGRIRVAMFTDSFMQGGTERQFTRLASNLDREEFELHVCCLHRKGPLSLELQDLEQPISEFPLTALYNANAARQFARLVRFLCERRIQILHAFDFYTDVFSVPAARVAGIPVILASRRELFDLRSPWQRRAAKFACRLSTGVVVNSAATAADVLNAGVARRERVHTLPNCIDLRDFDVKTNLEEIRANIGIPADALVAGTICVLRPEKDLETFLRACRIVQRAIPNARFVIVGEGPERKKLEQLSSELSIGTTVSFLGARDDISDLLAAMDVFVLTSRTESFPNAVLEAMAVGCPVVATNVGGVPEIVRDENTGFLAEVGNADRIASRMIHLLQNPQLRAEMSARAVKRVREDYSVEHISEDLQNLYRRLLWGHATGQQPI
jgi:L-malate glycosyltransferase